MVYIPGVSPELFSISGKTALITGGTSGIGLMIAEGYLRAGARVYISSRKPDACDAARQQLSEFGEVYAVPADVSREEQCRELVDAVGAREDKLDILVNNAGATWGAPFDEFPPAAFDKVLTLNVKAPFVLTQLARPLLEAASAEDDPARVINIGSIDGSDGAADGHVLLLGVQGRPAPVDQTSGPRTGAVHPCQCHCARAVSVEDDGRHAGGGR